MKTDDIKIQISKDIEGFTIAPETLFKIFEGSCNYLQSFKVTAGSIIWHGKISEANEGQVRGEVLLIGEWLAGQLGIVEGQKVKIGLSRLEPIVRMQLKPSKKDSSPLPNLVGVQPEVGQLFQYNDNNYTITSMDPRDGYISENTTVEILNAKGKVEVQKNSPKQHKSGGDKKNGFSNIIGMEQVIKDIEIKIIEPIRNPSLATKYLTTPLKGALLHGPYGIGKTALVRALGEELSIPVIFVSNSIATSQMGPNYIDNVYKIAAKSKEGAIIFLDEIDSVAPRDWQGSPITTALQEAMDGFDRNSKIFTLGATNNLHNVAEGLLRPGRFDLIIPMTLPDENARKELFTHFLSRVQTAPDINTKKLAAKTAAFSGADIESVCKNVGTNVLHKHCDTGKNQYISHDMLMAEVKSFTPTGARILGVAKPKFTFNDMYGADSMLKILKRKLDLMSGKVKSQYAVADNACILLHGESGTGKTMVAQCIADYLQCSFKYQPATGFKGSYVGETEANIRKLFNTGRTYAPIVIFLDEIDSIGKTRSSHDPHTASALNQLLTELDGIADNKGVFIVAATNRKDDLDPALLSRVSWDFKMSLPDSSQRIDILRGLLAELPCDQLDYMHLSRITSEWSQRNLAWLKSEVINKLALEEVTTITTGVLQDLIIQRPAESSIQSDLERRAS